MQILRYLSKEISLTSHNGWQCNFLLCIYYMYNLQEFNSKTIENFVFSNKIKHIVTFTRTKQDEHCLHEVALLCQWKPFNTKKLLVFTTKLGVGKQTKKFSKGVHQLKLAAIIIVPRIISATTTTTSHLSFGRKVLNTSEANAKMKRYANGLHFAC